MKLTQRHYLDSVELDLQDEAFEYTITTSGVKKRFSVDYLHFDPTVLEETEESNTWWRNVGIAWVILGAIFSWMRYVEQGAFRISFWLILGIVCLAIYRFSRTTFTHHATEGGGRVVLIKDSKSETILSELSKRRKRRLAEVYGDVDFDEDPEREIAKFRWLESQGALSSEEAAAKINAVRAAGEDIPQEPVSEVN